MDKNTFLTVTKIAGGIALIVTLLSWYDTSNIKELKQARKDIEQLKDSIFTRNVKIFKQTRKYEELIISLRDDVFVAPAKPKRDAYIRERITSQRNGGRQPLYNYEEERPKTRGVKEGNYIDTYATATNKRLYSAE